MIRLLFGGSDDLAKGLRLMLLVGLALGAVLPLIDGLWFGGGPPLSYVLIVGYTLSGPLVNAALIGLVVRAVGLTLVGRMGPSGPADAPAAPEPAALTGGTVTHGVGPSSWRPPTRG